MDRRTFVLLTGGVSSGLIVPPSTALHRPAPSGVAGTGRLRFELDDRRRWSLWYYGDGSPVPLVRDAEVLTWVGDRTLTLAELEDSAVGSRRPPGGDAVVVRGRAAGVWVEAEFLTASAAETPQAAVTVTVFPDRFLPSVKGVRFFQLPESGVLGGPGPLVALVNGYHSLDPFASWPWVDRRRLTWPATGRSGSPGGSGAWRSPSMRVSPARPASTSARRRSRRQASGSRRDRSGPRATPHACGWRSTRRATG